MSSRVCDDLRLVVTDMDGTLLDSNGQLPVGFAKAVRALTHRGILLTPASGRQLANLRHTLGPALAHHPMIAENGTLLVDGEQCLHRETIGRQSVSAVIEQVRQLCREDRADVGAVVATADVAYIEHIDPAFVSQVATYYTSHTVVDDLLALPLDDVLKVAVFDFVDAEACSASSLAASAPELQTVVSGKHWTDLMPPHASKGRALQILQAHLGITPSQTIVFGDYLNDLDLFPCAERSYAMANAHPAVRAVATHEAPAHTADGVLTVLETLLGPLR